MTKREIKFKAWNRIVKKMSKPFYLHDLPDNVQWQNLDILQFTGLKDINGTEIYEDDILKHHGIVAWNDVENQWSVIDLNWNDKREWHDIDYLTSPFKIIGNTHENPELLT